MDPVALSLFANRIEAICDEMGAVLRRAAFSPNIKDRLDFSCAVFDADGQLAAQAAHIPVHLGSMAFAMTDLVRAVDWAEGDVLVVNDPYLGGTHLPDITLISPVMVAGQCLGFVANRAHHANVGASTPGSMPISSTLAEEGLVIPPRKLVVAGTLDEALFAELCAHHGDDPGGAGDFNAQLACNRVGVTRLLALIAAGGADGYRARLAALNDYGERLARSALAAIPPGRYAFTDWMDDDGQGQRDIAIAVTLEADAQGLRVDFTGTAPQVAGNINCPLSVAAAAVFYVIRCLLPAQTPACAGSFRPVQLTAPTGCLVNARRPAACAAGNVETSSRIVDAVLGALAQALPERIPAASQGSMNNLAMGHVDDRTRWDYYETSGGGMGAGSAGPGLSGVQTHMTNSLNTPIEVLESHYPLRIHRYALRRGSGGEGRHRGGDGIVREFEILAPATATLLTERRYHAPWGLAGGAAGARGENRKNGALLPAKWQGPLVPGDRLTLASAGGGGWGSQTA